MCPFWLLIALHLAYSTPEEQRQNPEQSPFFLGGGDSFPLSEAKETSTQNT